MVAKLAISLFLRRISNVIYRGLFGSIVCHIVSAAPYPDPVVEIIYHVSYCLIKTDSSPREDILDDILELLYFVKSLIDTIREIKMGEAGDSLIIKNFFDNYQSMWSDEINNNYLQAMILIADCVYDDDHSLHGIVHSMSELQWIKEILFRTLKQPEECAEGV